MENERSLLHLLHRVSQISAERFAAVHGHGIRPRQLMVLRALAANPGASQTGLVSATGTDRSTMAEMVRRLEQRGLLKRRRSKDDSRAYSLDLTAEGLRVIKETAPTLAEVELKLLDLVPAKERGSFLAALEKIVIASEQPPDNG